MFDKRPQYLLYWALAISFAIIILAFINHYPLIKKNVQAITTAISESKNLAMNNKDLQSVLGTPLKSDFMPSAFYIENRSLLIGFNIEGPKGTAFIITMARFQPEQRQWKINLEYTNKADTKDGKRYVVIIKHNNNPEYLNKPALIREIPIYPEQSFLSEYYHGLGEILPWDNSYINNAKWLQKAVDHGNADAANDLSLYYDYGHGVKKDEAKERELQELGAKRGSYEAMYNLGLNYRISMTPDYAKAMQWYQHYLAVTSAIPYRYSIGYVCANNDIGLMYAKGQGTEISMEKADSYLHDAAENMLLVMKDANEDHADKVSAFIAYQKTKYVDGNETVDLFWKYPANVVYAAEQMSDAIKRVCWD